MWTQIRAASRAHHGTMLEFRHMWTSSIKYKEAFNSPNIPFTFVSYTVQSGPGARPFLIIDWTLFDGWLGHWHMSPRIQVDGTTSTSLVAVNSTMQYCICKVAIPDWACDISSACSSSISLKHGCTNTNTVSKMCSAAFKWLTYLKQWHTISPSLSYTQLHWGRPTDPQSRCLLFGNKNSNVMQFITTNFTGDSHLLGLQRRMSAPQ